MFKSVNPWSKTTNFQFIRLNSSNTMQSIVQIFRMKEVFLITANFRQIFKSNFRKKKESLMSIGKIFRTWNRKNNFWLNSLILKNKFSSKNCPNIKPSSENFITRSNICVKNSENTKKIILSNMRTKLFKSQRCCSFNRALNLKDRILSI